MHVYISKEGRICIIYINSALAKMPRLVPCNRSNVDDVAFLPLNHSGGKEPGNDHQRRDVDRHHLFNVCHHVFCSLLPCVIGMAAWHVSTNDV